jgi:hypothetical protein
LQVATLHCTVVLYSQTVQLYCTVVLYRCTVHCTLSSWVSVCEPLQVPPLMTGTVLYCTVQSCCTVVLNSCTVQLYCTVVLYSCTVQSYCTIILYTVHCTLICWSSGRSPGTNHRPYIRPAKYIPVQHKWLTWQHLLYNKGEWIASSTNTLYSCTVQLYCTVVLYSCTVQSYCTVVLYICTVQLYCTVVLYTVHCTLSSCLWAIASSPTYDRYCTVQLYCTVILYTVQSDCTVVLVEQQQYSVLQFLT